MPTTSEKCIRISLTSGNIRNGHVYLRDHLDFFFQDVPNGVPLGQVDFSLEFNGATPVITRIDETKAIFRWRGWAKLFKRSEANEADLVEFQRLGKARYRVLLHTRKIWPDAEIHQSIIDDSKIQNTPSKILQTAKSQSVRCNDLTGDEWLRCSISVWSDIRKTSEEMALNHPAMFPSALCDRLIGMFLRRKVKHRVLDPFMGSGSTLVAARSLGKIGIGFEINAEYVSLAKRRLDNPDIFSQQRLAPYQTYQCDARKLTEHIPDQSIDLCINSPPIGIFSSRNGRLT